MSHPAPAGLPAALPAPASPEVQALVDRVAAMSWRGHLPAEAVDRLLARRAVALAAFEAESTFPRADLEALWQAVDRTLAGLPALEAHQAALLATTQTHLDRVAPTGRLAQRPWGRVLVILPANAPVPLAAVIPATLLAGGNTVVVAGSRRVARTTDALVQPLEDLLPGEVLRWPGRAWEAVEQLLPRGLIDCVYFLGASRLHPELARRCAEAGVHLVYEGEGNGCAVVDETVSGELLADTARWLVEAKHFCRGQMCSAPNLLLVHEAVRGALFAALEAEAAAHALPEVGPGPHRLQLRAAASVPQALSEELFSPALWTRPWTDWEALVSELSRVPHRLQLSLFSAHAHRLEDLSRRTRMARYCWNMCPTDQDPLLPWGNFGHSGDSRVQDFYAKGLRPVILEGGAA